jgi:hypothetical protein
VWIALTFGLSVASYFLVERIFRNRSLVGRKAFWTAVAIALVTIVCISFTIINGRFVDNEKVTVVSLLDNGAYRKAHRIFEINHDYSVQQNGQKNLLVVGDSHAEDLFKAMSFSYLSKRYNLNLTSPKKRTEDINYQVRCLYEFLADGSTVCQKQEYAPNLAHQYKSADVIMLASTWDDPGDLDVLPNLLVELSKDAKEVIVVSSTPESKTFGEKRLNRFDAFLFINKRLPVSKELRDLEESFYQDYLAFGPINDKLKTAVSKFSSSSVHFADRSDFMCDKVSRRCHLYFEDSGAKVLWDYGHTTTEGARELAKSIDKIGWLSDIMDD